MDLKTVFEQIKINPNFFVVTNSQSIVSIGRMDGSNICNAIRITTTDNHLIWMCTDCKCIIGELCCCAIEGEPDLPKQEIIEVRRQYLSDLETIYQHMMEEETVVPPYENPPEEYVGDEYGYTEIVQPDDNANM